MTNEEAIRILDPDRKDVWKAYDGKDVQRCNEACRVAVKALEKQIPKKPLIKTHTYSGLDDDFTNKYYCPVCNELIVCEDTNGYYAGKIVEHCPCGQALDWTDE